MTLIADDGWIWESQSRGILLQGWTYEHGFDLCSIKVGDGAAPNPRWNWCVHYIGSFEQSEDGTTLVGKLTVRPYIRRFTCVIFFVGLIALAVSAATLFLFGAVIGLVIVAFVSTMAFLSLDRADEWDQLPQIIRKVFAGHFPSYSDP